MKKKIADNESMQDLKEYRQSAKFLKVASKLFGVKHDLDIDELITQSVKLETLPDSFNQVFAHKGWIAHDSLDVKVMEKSVQLGEDEGESVLIEYYEKQLEWFFKKLAHKPVFKERIELLNLAKEDYYCERYHSCIPVTLMLVDGIVNDFKETGLFADNTDLDVWDSIAGHSTGLKSLVSILTKSRKKTTTDSIDLPYRNGILHGRDLGYNNKIVAIKAFAVLFYVHDWSVSLKSESSRLDKYREENKKKEETTFLSLAKQITNSQKKIKESSKLRKEWEARSFDDNFQTMIIGEENPEFVALKFLEYIKNRNYGSPVDFYARNIYKDISIKDKAGMFRREFENIEIHNFQIDSIVDEAPAVTKVEVTVDYTKDGVQRNSNINFRMVYEVKEDVENRLVKGGSWKIVNIEGMSFQF